MSRGEDIPGKKSAYEVNVMFDSEEIITVKTGLLNISKGDIVRVSLSLNQIHFID